MFLLAASANVGTTELPTIRTPAMPSPMAFLRWVFTPPIFVKTYANLSFL
jgi:hypothetical protein